MKTNKDILNISIKMIITGIVAITLGYILNLQFYTTAAAVGILSIQATRKDFISIAFKRYISGFSSLVVSALLFYFLGVNLYTFSLFLIILIFLSWFLNASEGIVLSVVLVTHFLIVKEVTFTFFIEEVVLLTISIGVAFFVNMFYPSSSKQSMLNNLEQVDQIVVDYLKSIIELIENKTKFDNQVYNNKIEKILKETERIDKDLIIQNDHTYLTYLYMRDVQVKILNDICTNVPRITISHSNVLKIVNHLTNISENISFNNEAKYLYENHLQLQTYFIQSDLPKTRSEFETRAILFQILFDIERFLTIKIDFHIKHPKFNEKEF